MGAIRIGIALAVVGWALAACSGGGGSSAPPMPPPNAAPLANAGDDLTAQEADRLLLDGRSSSDPDGAISRFSWTQTSGPVVTLSDDDTAQPSFQAPLVAETTRVVFRLTVTDSDGARASDTVEIEIVAAQRPSRLEIETPYDGKTRTYTVYTPRDYAPGAPVVMLLHGGGGNMRRIFSLQTSAAARWVELADAEGLLLIAPNGFNEDDDDGLGDQQSWNDLRPNGNSTLSAEDDAGFLLSVLDAIGPAREIDPDRVFITGSSNGGMMSMRMLIEHPGRFFGAAAFIASLPAVEVADPAAPTPIMMLNGTADPLVRFEGGPVGRDRPATRPVLETVDYWARVNAADPARTQTAGLPETVPDDGCTVSVTRYFTASGAVAMTYYEALGGGHSIPDPDPPARSPALRAVLGPQCEEVHGVDLALAFLQSL